MEQFEKKGKLTVTDFTVLSVSDHRRKLPWYLR
jgi:hypothetical protein